MKKLREILTEDRVIKTGLIMILISAALFAFPELNLIELKEGADISFFFTNYLLSVIYLIIVLLTKPKRLAYWALVFLLWFISAFALNRSMNVFDSSVTWLCVAICVSCGAVILSIFINRFSSVAKHLLMFFLGAAFLLFLYYSLYLTSMYIIGLLAAIAIGISLHTFAPVALAVTTFIIIKRNVGESRSLKIAVGLGVTLPLIICSLFVWQWRSINTQVNQAINHNILSEGKLPAWVVISQNIPKNAIAERIIKANLVYKTANLQDNWFWGSFHNTSFDEPLKHDPLVVIASIFSGQTNLEESERIKILKAMYDSRHKAQERLWSGDKLTTSSVITNVKIFPEYRMAYTEKTLFVKKHEERTWWNRGQEAIYTFHLPEGAVVSSLSLWIDGKEEKSRLTTKAKADSAYKTVVGVEARDPSVIHWQEGNTVTARIFPCTVTEARKFRIGVTSPLKQRGQQLVYESIYFDGPPADDATETIQVSFSKKPALFNLPGFDEISEGVYTADRKYEPDEEIAFATTALADKPFTFAGKGYRLKDYKAQTTNFEPTAIYLDLNNSWTSAEFDNLWQSIKNKKVYYDDGGLKQLTEDNKTGVLQRAQKLNFSLFPVNEIRDADNALLITKCPQTSPNLNDLDDSEFQKRLTTYLATARPVRLYNIGTKLTPYLKALKEMRVFVYDDGGLEKLQANIAKHQFLQSQEDNKHVVLDQADMMIEQTADTTKSDAPDHLLRLFAYNDVMKKVGPHYFDKTYVQPDIINEAEQAYIASPVSSLIVLETQADYERFGIDANKNSLANASMKSSGAVPEPGEWLLVLIAVAVINFLVYRAKYARNDL
ncbi:XrtN system VIT domain-containing protein [Mucilaginibacter flavus]|uniref:XrtN system VIT domain-containing protein n=1 Tax=Mucilaginibacter flavus TaxID=931504 RepID=UPI0025B4013B|nr:XrtN system VIT domain-containing protein [Mucilaginibacter flavus]MDN3579516.1 XrtN system VIT domain-containing protein [Mucilaginibacter flavus]